MNPLRVPPPDTSIIERAYQDFCQNPLSATKQCIPCGRWKNYEQYWDKECETLYRSFLLAPVWTDSDGATSSLLSRLEQKQERWEEAVNSIDLTSRTLAISKLTGRSGRSSRLCPVSANSISSQLVKNGEHRTGGRGTTRLVNKQLYDLWKIPTHEGHSISEPFRP